MAVQPKFQPQAFAQPAQALPRLGPNLSEAQAQDPVASPALALQSALTEAFEAEPRWSARRTLGFAVITCGAFWMGVGLVIARVLAH